jgi:hypothetical protein
MGSTILPILFMAGVIFTIAIGITVAGLRAASDGFENEDGFHSSSIATRLEAAAAEGLKSRLAAIDGVTPRQCAPDICPAQPPLAPIKRISEDYELIPDGAVASIPRANAHSGSGDSEDFACMV